MNPVNFGIVGCGVIGRTHVRSAQDLAAVKIAAVADIREEAAQEVAAEYGVETVYTDATALFADPQIEAVVLALPAQMRLDLALRAFAQGKHVLTEKPVARNVAEVKQLLEAQGDLVAGCCSSRFHFLESTRVVADFIATGALGDLRVVRCRAIKPAGPPPETMPPAWRLSRTMNGGGIMSNWGCYDLDYLLGITGWSLEPRQLLAQTWTVPPALATHVTSNSDAETHLATLIQCAGGTVITYERGEYVGAQAEQSWEIIGSLGSLQLQMTPGQNKQIIHSAADAASGTKSSILWQGDDTYADIHPGPINDFAAAIREGRPPQTTLERALIIQQITDAIYKSAESGRAVELSA